MSSVDVNSLLGEVTQDNPCGDDLEYDPVFTELERAVQGRSEQSLGDSVIQAEPPDWRNVRKLATDILGRSKDLRAGVFLTRALVQADSYEGLSDGLALVRGLLEKYWEDAYPRLDPDDNNDPAIRVNTIASLCDRATILNSILDADIVVSRAMGRVSLRHILIAKGEIPLSADTNASVPDQATIDAAFMDAELESLQSTSDALTRLQKDLAAIDAVLMDKVGSAQAPDLDALADILKGARAVMSSQLSRRGVADEDEGSAGSPQAAASVAGANQSVNGEINSRQDAALMMDKISDYFKRYEPSSPVPLLMLRAKRLATMDFMEILRDIAPDGVKQAENVSGIGEG
jgi:type VI secretion system protein ImpA